MQLSLCRPTTQATSVKKNIFQPLFDLCILFLFLFLLALDTEPKAKCMLSTSYHWITHTLSALTWQLKWKYRNAFGELTSVQSLPFSCSSCGRNASFPWFPWALVLALNHGCLALFLKLDGVKSDSLWSGINQGSPLSENSERLL